MSKAPSLTGKQIVAFLKLRMKKNIIGIIILLSAVIFLYPLTAKAVSNSAVKRGRALFLKSGCLRCHSLVKGKKIRGIDTLYGFGDRHLTINEAMKAIRSCRMDTVCTEVLTNPQVNDVAHYLNSLKK